MTEATDPTTTVGVAYDPVDIYRKYAEQFGIDESQELTTLPISGRQVPANFTVGKIKTRRSITQHAEGEQVSIEVLVDGKVIAYAECEGTGDGIFARPVAAGARQLIDRIETAYWVQKGRPTLLLVETLWGIILEEHEAQKSLQRKFKAGKKTCCLKGLDSRLAYRDYGFGSDDGNTDFYSIQWLEVNRPYTWSLENADKLKADGITHVFDGTEWKAL
jgi:hypothetical protein